MNSNGNSLTQQAVRIVMTDWDAEIGVIEYNSRGARLVVRGDVRKGGCFPVAIWHLSNKIECWAQVLWTKPLGSEQSVVGVTFTEPPGCPADEKKTHPFVRKDSRPPDTGQDFWSTALDLWS